VVGVDDPREVYEHRDRYQILDVREPYEWDAGHIEEAIHVPLADVMAGRGQDQLDSSRPVVVVCRTGNRSELATLMLQARGFEAHNLEGGAERWVASGLPIVAADGSPGRVA
jgi:rhodanese-related sulfurtransferase